MNTTAATASRSAPTTATETVCAALLAQGQRLQAQRGTDPAVASEHAAIRESLIEHFLPLARGVAFRCRHRAAEFEDALQAARVGVVVAVDALLRRDQDLLPRQINAFVAKTAARHVWKSWQPIVCALRPDGSHTSEWADDLVQTPPDRTVEDSIQLRQMLADVPVRSRAALELHTGLADGVDHSVAEVAKMLGIPPQIARSRIDDARKRLRRSARRSTFSTDHSWVPALSTRRSRRPTSRSR